MKRKQNGIRLSREDKIVNAVSVLIALFVLIVTVYPIYYCVIYAFSDGMAAQAKHIYFWPIQFTLSNFQAVFDDDLLVNSLVISVLRTAVSVVTSVLFTAFTAYGLTRKELKGQKIYSMIAMFTMYFGGGVIPTYLLYQKMGLLNTFAVYFVPGLLSVYNMLLFMAFFRDLPESLVESAKLDGAGVLTIFVRIVVPLSKPIFATISLFVGVGAWNDWYAAAYYINDQKLMPMSTILMRLVSAANAAEKAMEAATASGANVHISGPTSTSIQYATMLVSIVPVMCVYPFVQKYFVKGIMVGAVKA
ncbi:MAG: carbohydrate ABC transporter permease [Lachnospiraceae bacterium]|nr:carbohydrate ABC transporter permease [Lachnospiraceae bacterium]